MKIFLLLLLYSVPYYAQSALQDTEYEYYDEYTQETTDAPVVDNVVPSLFSTVSNTTTAPVIDPPSLSELPSLGTISSILNATNTLEDIKSKFEKSLIPYEGTNGFTPKVEYQGMWWRFYTENSKLFNIPAVSEEILIIESNGQSIWLQNIKTSETLESQMQRLLRITQYNLFGHNFFVFHYADQDPLSQSVRDKQGFFIRTLPDQEYLQMSKTPSFEPQQSIYWKKFPKFEQASDSTNDTETNDFDF
ncbi:MAG: hypothetical protein ACRCV0_01260 [Brevinema sp.]